MDPDDTFYSDLEAFSPYYRGIGRRFDQALWIGDKNPRLYDVFDNLKQQFPDATVLMMFRNIFDVAASYKRRARRAPTLELARDRVLDSDDVFEISLHAPFADYRSILERAL